ncbi:helix-hairpin-helix domain-containing protein [Lentibacillus cibarius]|uniref:ComEA family DNA-binding protein n=1 Tax=Lentibacillus cibarius TaxID=2583219 RepID=A0A5S3QGP7_9BACI|nr:helix-hairpin-helix domain-containing protein [Lentibacillus cibarius]TMN21018.1 ComEA family DNA-binding protein [Lentibacillus cibarius]
MFYLLKKYLFPIILVLIVGIFLFWNNDSSDEAILEKESTNPNLKADSPDDSKVKQQPTEVMVDVKGEVVAPGVYETAADARVHDVIQMAGGFKKNADQTTVNLAQKVQDEMVIMVPAIAENATPSSVTSKTGTKKVRINYADQAEIEELNGIGPSKAQAVIQYREENGLFKDTEDLLDVSGIGEKTLEALKEEIQIP